MVPDKFNMVDMGGIDLIMMQGEEVPGLYNRLVESIAQCRYQCLYNWLFDGIIIPPTYVEMEVGLDEEVRINEGVVVTSDDVIHIYSFEPTPIVPVIEELYVNSNGTYIAPEGVDGYSPVIANITSMITLDREPTIDDGNVGDYCLATLPIEFDTVGVEITVAGRGSSFNFTYYGTCALRLTLKDSEDNIINVTDLPNATFNISSSSISGSNTNATPALTANPDGYYYERSGLPGYFKVTATGIGNYTPVSIGFTRRTGTQWQDFVSSFNVILIKNNTKVGVLKTVTGLTFSDWPNNQIVTFSDFASPTEKKLYYKTELGWVLVI